MKTLFLSALLFCSLFWQPISSHASSADFEETVDKLILVTNGVRRYTENYTHLLKQNDPDVQRRSGGDVK